MTREEAIKRMKIIKGNCYIIDKPKDKEAFDMSIFALEQEPYELLIIKSDILLHQEDRKKWIESIKREKENGVIILPPYFEPLLVPNDIEINIEQEPCEDAISRAEVKRIVDFYKEQYDGIYHINESIDALPSVEPCNKPTHYGDSTEKCKSCEYKRNTCDDAISREAVLKRIAQFSTEEGSSVVCQPLYSDVNNMPSVTQKSGKWINTADACMSDNIVCSKCGYNSIASYNYCPNCGAKMVEPQESEG